MRKVGDYYYVYGMGYQPNRHLEFYQDEISAQISVIAYAQIGIKLSDGQEIGRISGENLIVEQISATDQLNYQRAKREGKNPNSLPKICNLDNYVQPQDLLRNLEPRGSWKIMVENQINENNPRFEKPFRLTFVNVS